MVPEEKESVFLQVQQWFDDNATRNEAAKKFLSLLRDESFYSTAEKRFKHKWNWVQTHKFHTLDFRHHHLHFHWKGNQRLRGQTLECPWGLPLQVRWASFLSLCQQREYTHAHRGPTCTPTHIQVCTQVSHQGTHYKLTLPNSTLS